MWPLLAGVIGIGMHQGSALPRPPLAVRAVQPQVVRINVLPTAVRLAGARAVARFAVTAHLSDGSVRDVSDECGRRTTNLATVRIATDRSVRPAADGKTELVFSYAGKSAKARIEVSNAAVDAPIDFSREVVPILTRNGCNQGACHGSQFGKGGFRLSLAGFDPDVDFESIVRQAGGRRIARTQPGRSLLLLKPSLTSPHVGGLRLRRGSSDYSLLARWLAEGTSRPAAGAASVASIEVVPKERVLAGGDTQRLVVRAVYTDGSTADVTEWARFNSLNDAVVAVTPGGRVKASAQGETNVMVRFGGQAAVARFSIPYASPAPRFQFAEANYIDKHVARKWRTLGLAPSEVCDDPTFLRRVMLDLIGTLPTPDEIRAFLADTSSNKRAKLIDRVLERPEYADYWTLKWGDLLRSNRTALGVKGMWSLTNWVREQFRENRPFDKFAADLITAQGSTFTNGPSNFYRVANSASDRAETTAQVFLGMRLQCAKCHHHPFERWSQADYYQFAAFFARVGTKGSQEFGMFGNEQVVRLDNGGEVYHPKSGAKMKPTPLGGYPDAMKSKGPKTADLVDPDADAGGDRRRLLADWITQSNSLFARNIANRYWGYLMGKGLVEPIDDQRVTNPPTNPELLDELGAEFAANGYDAKKLLRAICNSRTYQLSSEVTSYNKRDRAYYSHYQLKQLPAEALYDAVNTATGATDKFAGLPSGLRAIQLPDPLVDSYFLDTFGRPPRVIACECERAAEPNMVQALHLMMGEGINRKLQHAESVVAKLLSAKKTDEEMVGEFYLRALARPATSEEVSKSVGIIRDAQEKRIELPPLPFLGQVSLAQSQASKDRERKTTLEDILWALINSKEFLFIR